MADFGAALRVSPFSTRGAAAFCRPELALARPLVHYLSRVERRPLNGMWTLVDATNTTADIEVKIADLPAGETAILKFVASVVFNSADPIDVTDTVTVESETPDTNPANDTAQLVTTVGQ